MNKVRYCDPIALLMECGLAQDKAAAIAEGCINLETAKESDGEDGE